MSPWWCALYIGLGLIPLAAIALFVGYLWLCAKLWADDIHD